MSAKPKPDTMENLPPEQKVKLMLAGVNFHLKAILADRVDKSKLVTNTLNDARRWELESLLTEIIKYQFVIRVLEEIIRFL